MVDYVDVVLKDSYSKDKVLNLFYGSLTEHDEILNKHSEENLFTSAQRVLSIIHSCTVDEIVDILDNGVDVTGDICAANIPQFSNLDVVDDLLPLVLSNTGNELNYCLMGYFFNKMAKETAQTKYGENHYKLAVLLGLVKKGRPFAVTPMGQLYMELSKDIKRDIKEKLFLRIPIIRAIMILAKKGSVNVHEMMLAELSESTVARRKSNVRSLINKLIEKSEFKELYQNNIIWN